MPARDPELLLVADPLARSNPRLVLAAQRAGASGVLDVRGPEDGVHLRALQRRSNSPYVLRVPAGLHPTDLGTDLDGDLTLVVVEVAPAGHLADPEVLRSFVAAWAPRRVIAQVTSRAEATAALAVGCRGLVASGSEAGGRIGDTEACILLQQLQRLDVPVWVRGGIGLHTAAAAIAGGAVGVMLDAQLSLTPEADLPEDLVRAITAMDGSETRVVGRHRFLTRPDLPAAQLPDDTAPEAVAEMLGDQLTRQLVAIGQDGALAASLTRRYGTVGGIVAAVRAAVASHRADAATHQPLAPGAGIATTHGLRYPIAQGPMTRVSDRAEFAAAVAEGGGLPFLALALMRGAEVRTLLEQTAELLGDRPWGVGILGFVPAELREEQLAVVHDLKPPAALIAGGRPSQAEPLEAAGIPTYLHVPSPGLLDRFLRDGARRFVFEGRECGGHVGPRASFPLWDAQIERLLAFEHPEELDVLFAGGIHDATSAAMVATAAAPLAARGARLGVLMGTAYLFTDEAVGAGAISEPFRAAAVACDTTVLLETSPGHATRCVETDYVRTFAARKAELQQAGTDAKTMWGELEQLNLGRLRIASKRLTRRDDELVELDDEACRREGMFMIGQVATLRQEHTTVAALHEEVSGGSRARLAALGAAAITVSRVTPRGGPLDVAIVGMASLYPGARSTAELWGNIVRGENHVGEVSPQRWDATIAWDPDGVPGVTTPSKWGGFLPEVGFDPFAYGIPPASLASVDPVQLLSLEVATRALADAGYATREFDRSRASVVFGAESGTDLAAAYGLRGVYPQLFGPLPPELDAYLPVLTEDSFPGVLTNVIAGRIANRLDLGGVNYTVDAACASSLAAVDAACKELLAGTSDLVICGGADLHNGIADYLLFSSVRALSPTGQCRPFDASADGIALGEGIAAIVVKRRADAERDGDRIYALLDGIAGSSDGRSLGLTAPRKEGQQRAVLRAHEHLEAPLSSLGLVEAHGTGTVVGDRTEMATLTELFAADGSEPGSCVLGSVKSQIGHTKCAAGIAGLIKATRAVYHGVLPPTGNLTSPNTYYDEGSSPFRFLDTAQPWTTPQRRAGVSAFGFGGTNFHAVVSSYDGADQPAHGLDTWPAELFLLRGEQLDDARQRAAELATLVAQIVAVDPDGERHALRNLARSTCSAGRGSVQLAFVADDLADLAGKAQAAAAATTGPGVFVADSARTGPVGYLYPGQGSQRPGMLGELFVAFPWLRSVLAAAPRYQDVLFPPAAFTPEARRANQAAITDTRNAQPTLGIAGVAMTQMLDALGVSPVGAGGHSYGELVALWAAGVYDEATLLELSEGRAEAIMEAIAAVGDDPGAMAAVSLPIDELRQRLEAWPQLVVANHNAPRQAVLSGPTEVVDDAVRVLLEDGVSAKRIPVACAFHSSVIADAATGLAKRLADRAITAPRFPVWCNTTAETYPSAPEDLRELLAAQVANPVRFVEQIESMYAAGIRVFVEVGPGRVLSGLVDKVLGDRPHRAVATDVSGESGLRRLLLAIAELAVAGVELDVTPLFKGRATSVDLRSLPLPMPGWRINGHLVRTASGTVLPGSLQPADERPTLTAPSSGSPTLAATGGLQEATVLEYVRSVRELVAAERDVMLRYLGADPLAPVTGIVPLATTVGATPAISAAPAAAPASVVSGAALLEAVLTVVSDRTGYPVEMLDPDLDLEADLSIDSIKRMEILAELAERIGLPGMDADSMDEAVVEELAQRKTLRAIVAWIDDHAADQRTQPNTVTGEHVAASAASVVSGAALLEAVLTVVSDRTGYPVEMLDPDLDLEADLSIDSIKRMEILAELAERIGLPGMDADSMDEAVVEELAQRKTLRAIVAWIDDHNAGTAGAPASEDDAPAPAHPRVPDRAVRHTLQLVPVLGPNPVGVLVGRNVLVVAPDGDALATALADELTARGASVTLADDTDAVPAAAGTADALVHLGAADDTSPRDARSLYPTLRAAALGSPQRLLAVTAAGGEFGSGPSAESLGDPGGTGVSGLLRTIKAELPDRQVRHVDLDLHAAAANLAETARRLTDELADDAGPVSIGWSHDERHTLELVPEVAHDDARFPLDPASVTLLTGGARGITARVACALAGAAAGGHFVLVGRSPLPTDEDPRTRTAIDVPALRRTLLELGELSTPPAIEAACRATLGAREMRATFESLAALGATVEYHELDVRDAPALRALVAGVVERHGRLDGVVHGAGILDDRFLRDKEPADYERVFATKVDAARALLDTAPDDTSFIVLFGSVSGVFGNRGQADYAAANDALDGLARHANARRTGRVVSIDWGPWAGGGMVSPELERAYERRGIGLVDPDDGVGAVLQELREGPQGPAQVVVMRALAENLFEPEPSEPHRG